MVKKKPKSMGVRSILKAYAKKEENLRASHKTKEQKEYEKPSLQEGISKLKREKKKAILNKIGDKIIPSKEALSKRIKRKKVLKPNKLTYALPKREEYSVLGEPNRFFKAEMEEVRRNLFFD